MHVVSRHEISAEEAFDDAPRGIDESSSIFSTIERNVSVNIPSNEGGESFKQRKTMKTQIKFLKKTLVRKVKWFHSRNKPIAQTSTTDMVTELQSRLEQIAAQSVIPQNSSPSLSALSPYEDDVLAPASPLDSEIPAPTWYAAHVPTRQDYVADGVYGPGSPGSVQDSGAELFANIPRTIPSVYQQQSMSASSELNNYDTSAMVLPSFYMGATESDIESASSFSTDDSSSGDSSDDGSDQLSRVSKTSAELARNDSDLSTLGDESSSLDRSSNIESDYDEALVSQEQRESSEFGGASSDIALHDFASLSNGFPAIESGPMVFAAIINSAPGIEGPLQAMQARPRVHVTFEDNVHDTQPNDALPELSRSDDIVVQDAGMSPRTFASNGEGRCPPISVFADGIGHGDEGSPFSLTSPILPLFCRDDGSRSISFSDILASAGSSLPENAHMPEHASMGTANALQPNVEALGVVNFGDLIAEIDEIIHEATKPASPRIHEDSSSTKRESWICNFLNFERRRNSLLATGDYESENSDQEEFLEDNDTNETFGNTERTGILIERCNENLSLGRRWITTKLLLERIEKDTGFSEITKDPSTNEADIYERCPFEASIVDRTEKSPGEQRSSRFARKSSEHSTRIMDFVTESESHDSESREISKAQKKELIEIVYDYRTLFRHLIWAMVLPCGDELRRLIQEIFYVRIMETEVVAEAARINREISATMTNFVEFPAKFLAYLQARLERCSPAFECLEKLSKKCHNEMVKLETDFSSNIGEFVSKIKEIATIRVRALDLYDYLVKVYEGRDDFDEDYIHEWTRVAEYRRITLWYQNVNTARFQNLLTENISTLGKTGQTISEILIMTHGNIQSARKVLSMTEEGSLVS